MDCKEFLKNNCYFIPRTDFKLKGFEHDQLFETEKFLWECYRKYELVNSRWPLQRSEWQIQLQKDCKDLGYPNVHLEMHAKIWNYQGPVFFGLRVTAIVYSYINRRYLKEDERDQLTEKEIERLGKEDRKRYTKEIATLFLKKHIAYKPGEIFKQKALYDLYLANMKDFMEYPLPIIHFQRLIAENFPQGVVRGVDDGTEWRELIFTYSGLDREKIQKQLNKEVRNV